MKMTLYNLLLLHVGFSQISGYGISDLSLDRALFKAKIQFQKNLNSAWNSNQISDSLYFQLNQFDESLIMLIQKSDTLSLNPLTIEYNVNLSYNDNRLILQDVNIASVKKNDKKYWVKYKRIEDEFNYYYGIGKSLYSKNEANQNAYNNFAKNVEVKVKSLFEMEKVEQNETISSFKRTANEILTDVSLKGVSITESYTDTVSYQPLEIIYYSLIKYKKDDYNKIIIEEGKREFDKKIALLKKEQERINEEIRLKQIEEEKKQKQLEAEKAAEERKKERENMFMRQFKEFLDTEAPSQFIQMYSADLPESAIKINPELSLDPFSLNSAQASFTLGELEIYARAHYLNNKQVRKPEFTAKLRVLPHKGKFNVTSLAIGYTFYSNDTIESLTDTKFEQSLTGYANISFPEFLFSQAAIYIDKRQINLGIITYPFFRNLGSTLGLVGELHYKFDDNYSNKYKDDVFFNFGIKFRASTNYSTTISYIENHKYLLQIEIGI